MSFPTDKKRVAEDLVPDEKWYRAMGHNVSYGHIAFWCAWIFVIEPFFFSTNQWTMTVFLMILFVTFRVLLERFEPTHPFTLNARMDDLNALCRTNTLPRIDDFIYLANMRIILCIGLFGGVGFGASLAHIQPSDVRAVDIVTRLWSVVLCSAIWYVLTRIELSIRSSRIRSKFRR